MSRRRNVRSFEAPTSTPEAIEAEVEKKKKASSERARYARKRRQNRGGKRRRRDLYGPDEDGQR